MLSGRMAAEGAAETAYRLILEKVLDGTFKGGYHLKEEALAELTRVSRTPVREAIRRLQSDGYVEFLPNRGAFVAVWSQRDLDDIFGLRAIVEGYAARLAVERADLDDLDRLGALAEEMSESVKRSDEDALARMVDLNSRFHAALHQAAHSERLATIAAGIVDLSLAGRTWRQYRPNEAEISIHEHTEIVEAIRARDAGWAESTAMKHVLRARRTFRHSNETVASGPAMD